MLAKLKLPATRWGAFAGHIILSLLIFAALGLLIMCVMFPGALFNYAGGIDGIKIVAGVDLVLGPLLTLVIYNIAKPRKELYRDLAIIGLIQFSALAAGMYIVYQSRPAAIVYAYDSFYAVKSIEYATFDKEKPDNLNLFSPRYYYIQLPESNTEAMQAIVAIDMQGTPLRLHSGRYLPLADDTAGLSQILRVGKLTTDTSTETCLRRALETAFSSEPLCFDIEKKRFYIE